MERGLLLPQTAATSEYAVQNPSGIELMKRMAARSSMPVPRAYGPSGNRWRIIRSRAEAPFRLHRRDRSWPPAACERDEWIGDFGQPVIHPVGAGVRSRDGAASVGGPTPPRGRSCSERYGPMPGGRSPGD